MNTLEQLTAQDKGNYRTYLDRMSQSCATSSKHLIPFYTIGCNTILDVGCADGTLMKAIQAVNPTARVVGIDLNQNAVDLATAAGLEVYKTDFKDICEQLQIKFDCIIFSSVLHEISSYDKEFPFSKAPIDRAIILANKSLVEGGTLIIRDGLMDHTFCRVCSMTFHNPNDIKWFKRFLAEFKYPYMDFDSFEYWGNVTCDPELAQEFFATYTWGEDSWHREIQEKFCILDENTWTYTVREKLFDIIAFFKSKEEYPQFLKEKVSVKNEWGNEVFPYMTCTIVAQKKGEF